MIEDDNAQLRRRPVIRVFVSSTFTDLKHERDALQRDVFPKLEQLCASRQFQFQAIDLRWGVPTEASLDHRTMQICFEELRRSQEISPQPNFLILLGNRYGWRPLPEEVSEDEFRRLEQAASSIPAGDILSAWYRRDENAVPPVHLLQSRKQNLNDGRDYTNDQVWNEVQRVLWDVINHAYPADQLAGRFDKPAPLDGPLPAIVRFQASATEQEIWRGALGAPNASQHVLALVREIENIGEFQLPVEIKDFVDVDESGAIDAVSQDALRKLKEQIRTRLGEDNVIGIEHARLTRSTNEQGELNIDVTNGHLEELCARVEAALEAIIHRQITEYWGTSGTDIPSARALELERLEHQRFGQERAPADSFLGRQRHLQAIKSYLSNDSHAPLVIHGASGCGKTALLARAAQDAAPEWKPVVRFVGVTPHSSDIRSLLASLCQELRQRHPLDSPLPGDVHELTRELQEHLKAATVHEPLILFLDALDQLADADNGRSLFWIPFGPLPSHVKLIVSCLSDRAPEDPVGQPYVALKRRGLAEEDFINLDALSEGEAQTLLFERWLPQARRTLNHEQARRVRERLASDACRLPFYLKVLFEEARLWRSYDSVPGLGDDVPDLLGALFNRLGDPANHGETVECALGYIASARRGLTEMEILEVLYRDPDYKKLFDEMTATTRHKLPENPQRIPIAIWSRLRFDLAPYLAEHAAPGGTVLEFYHRQVGEYVRGRFLDTPLKKQKRHERLAEYFHRQDYFLESSDAQRTRARTAPPTPRPVKVRKVDELPWQQLRAGHQENLVSLLGSPTFLEAKVEAGLVFDLVTDFAHAVRAMPADPSRLRLKLLAEAIRNVAHFLACNPTMLFQCLWDSCWWFDAPEAAAYYEPTTIEPSDLPSPKLFELLETWRATKERATPGFVWLRSLRPPPVHLGSPQETLLQSPNGPATSVALTADGSRIVSGSEDRAIRVWDSETGLEVACFRTRGTVKSVAVTSDGNRIVAADGLDVRVWDVETRAELYSFSGHERRVNSVAVACDGRRIVSGASDGTIRVWCTQERAELHCFVGHEGWVWSVACFPADARVASASGDGTVRVWNGDTGRQLKRLCGHSGAVKTVAVTKDGTRIVSGGLDGTIRIWDAASGVQLHCLHCDGIGVNSVAVTGGGTLVSGGFEEVVRVWNVETGAAIRSLSGHQGIVNGVAVPPNGRMAVSAADDCTVRRWALESTEELRPLTGHEGAITVVTRLPHQPRFISGGEDATIRLWDSESGAQVRCLRGHEYAGVVHCIAVSSDGDWIASGSRDTTVRIWKVESSAEVRCLRGHEDAVRSLCVSPDGERIASAGLDGTVRLWDVKSGKEVHRLNGHAGGATCVALSPDGERIVSAAFDGTVRVWDSETGAELDSVTSVKGWIWALAVSRGGQRVIIGTWCGSIRAWDRGADGGVRCLDGHEGAVTGLLLVGNDMVISASRDETIRKWNLSTGECEEIIAGGGDLVAVATHDTPYHLLARGSCGIVCNATTRENMTVIPAGLEHVTYDSERRSWAAVDCRHRHLCLWKLEGHVNGRLGLEGDKSRSVPP